MAADLALAWRFARRELRGGLAGFRLFLACLALGVAAIAAVGSLSSAIVEGLRNNGRALLGADVELRLAHRMAGAEELAWLRQRGTLSTLVEMRAIGRSGASDRRTLIELKAVDGLYPLYGEMALEPGQPLDQALAAQDGRFGAVVERGLLAKLGLEPGGEIQVGEARLQVRGVILREPDRGADALALGPRVMIAAEALPATRLVQPGSLIYWNYRLKLPPETAVAPFVQALRQAFPDAGWRVRDFSNGTPGIRQWVDRIGLFLTLVGLTALLVGGVGVGNAVRSHLEGKTATIATLKCLGASSRVIAFTYLLQVLVLAALGVVLGLAIGALVPMVLAGLLADRLPVPPEVGLYPGALALAALFGLLTALAFALWPLARAREVAAAGLFRELIAPSRRWPQPVYVAATALAVLGLAALAVLSAADRRFALWFVLGAAGTFLVLRLAAAGAMLLARRAGRPRYPALRIALANLHRPGASTPSIVLSLGLGLTLLVAVALIQGNLSRQVAERLPDEAPAFFFVDLQTDQIPAFEALARGIPGVAEVDRMPMLRGRIIKVNGVPAERVQVAAGSQWALRSDRGLTYSATVPKGSTVVKGDWWPADYKGPPLISFDAGIAEGMGLEPGDTLTLNVLGRDVEARIANLRRIDWGTLGINFTVVFAPGTLEAAPHSHIATARATGAAEEALYKAVTDRFANVTAIRMKEALATVSEMLERIGAAVRAAASVTLLSGVLVLAGAMAAGHRRRVYDAVILKVLGATRLDVLKAYLLEYALLGLMTAVIAGAIGWVAAWLVVTQVMNADWVALPLTLALTAALSILATVLLGLIGTWRALSKPPAAVLRTA